MLQEPLPMASDDPVLISSAVAELTELHHFSNDNTNPNSNLAVLKLQFGNPCRENNTHSCKSASTAG